MTRPRTRMRGSLLLAAGATVATLGAAGCGEKQEPAVRPPATTGLTTTPSTTAPATTTAPVSGTATTRPSTPTGPVPKTKAGP